MFQYLFYFMEYNPSDGEQRGDPLRKNCILQ